LAAARLRARCVLAEGCPVLRVHRSFGFARHMGQRTDNMCRNVSFSGSTLILFNTAKAEDGQFCSPRFNRPQNGKLPGNDQFLLTRAGDQPSIVETSPASTPASLALRKRRRIFPDRVLGKDATNSNDDGVAIGPSSLRTCSMSAAERASEAT
jgi:hypothetical protein